MKRNTAFGVLILGLVAFFGAPAAMIAWVMGITSGDDSLQRVVDTGTITFERSGRYTMYHESRSVIDGKAYTAEPGEIEVTLQNLKTGEEVELAAYGGSARYQYGPHVGEAFTSFTIESPGEYELTGRRVSAAPVVLSVGRPMWITFVRVAGLFVLMFAGLAAALLGTSYLLSRQVSSRPVVAAAR